MVAGTAFVRSDPREVWAMVEPLLPRTRSTPEAIADVLRQCDDGLAVCFLAPEAAMYVTFEPLRDDTMAFVVLLSAGHPGAFKAREADLLAIAADAGCSLVQFDTDRRGWRRLLGPEWIETAAGRFSRRT